MSRTSTFLSILSIIFTFTSRSSGFELTFPTPSHYWVACGWNNITWRSTSPPDPSHITLVLTHPNKTLLNSDFAIGNALQGSLNAAMVYIPCLTPADGYSVEIVPVGWDSKNSKVLYTSPSFPIKPRGTTPDPASGQTSIPSLYQPSLQTPGIVIPTPDKLGQLVNTTTANLNSTNNEALPKLDASAANFGSFQKANGAAMGSEVLNDLMFLTVIAAFTVLVVTT